MYLLGKHEGAVDEVRPLEVRLINLAVGSDRQCCCLLDPQGSKNQAVDRQNPHQGKAHGFLQASHHRDLKCEQLITEEGEPVSKRTRGKNVRETS